MPCIEDPKIFCGSDEAINVYSTGQKGKNLIISTMFKNLSNSSLLSL